MITQERAKTLLDYNPETGILTWKTSTSHRRMSGQVAGCKSPIHQNRVLVRLDDVLYPASRIIWLITHSESMPKHVDHINGDPTDNRLINLRAATPEQNGHNRGKNKNNTSGWKGVNRVRGKWEAKIMANRIKYHLGYFDDPREAAEEYMFAALRLHGDFARLQ